MKLVCFLRHYNDIDHVTPIVSHGVTRNAFEAEIVLTRDEALREDYRLDALATLDGVTLSHVSDFGVAAVRSKREQTSRYRWAVSRRLPTAIPDGVRQRVRGEPTDSLIDPDAVESMVATLRAEDRRTVFAHDWVTTNMLEDRRTFVSAVSAATQDFGCPFVSLPHGDAPYRNVLFKRDSLDFEAAREQYRPGRYFDVVVVPNQLCAGRYEPHLPDARIAVLGSPRYNRQWLRELPNLLPRQDTPPQGGLNLVFFLRDETYAIHWEELRRTIGFVADIPGVELVVKQHTRGIADQFDDLDLPNVHFVADELHSPVLLDWSDAVIDLGTSVSFESVMHGDPVLELEYLHPNCSTVAAYVEATAMQTRDDLYHAVRRLTDSTAEFYGAGDRDSFVDTVVEAGNEPVLDGYVAFLEAVDVQRGPEVA